MTTITMSKDYEIIECCSCGIEIIVSVEWQKRLMKEKTLFYCSSGHSQSYGGKKSEQILRDEIAAKDMLIRRQELRIEELSKPKRKYVKKIKKDAKENDKEESKA